MTSKLKVDEIAPRTVDRITGIKLYDVSQWRVTTDFTGDATPIATNLEEVDAPVGFGKLGSSMSESSGIFSFPAVGMWWVEFTVYATNANYKEQVLYISTTTNNSTYATAAYGAQIKAQSAGSGVANISTLFDVTDTAQCKCKFNVTQEGATVTTRGDTAVNETYMTFMRLGDT
tara:strand:- start:305 stop:826 length:522 start_codon:yes stop_codon:yes gene_type:complete